MLKAAVVGVGHLGNFHVQKYAASANADLVAICDVNKRRAEEIGSRHDVKATDDYRELVSMGVECASVACDTAAHFEVAMHLLKNGIDVLVEKPICTSVSQAEALVKCAQENGRVMQVGHLERFNPAFKQMKQFLTRPVFLEARRITPFRGRGVDVDVVLDLMIHDIDIIQTIVKSPVKNIDAHGAPVLTRSIDIANARITFANQCVANVTASRNKHCNR